MKIHLSALHDNEAVSLLSSRGRESTRHEIVDDPDSAELILLVGNFGRSPSILLNHPLYRRNFDRCAVYTEDDNYLPLAPGVYCSAENDRSGRAGRVFNYSYVARNGRYRNAHISDDESEVAQSSHMDKRYLFSFLGGSTSFVRKRLYNINYCRADIIVENTSRYWHWDDTQSGRYALQKRYAEILAASHFALCPRGGGAGSIRFFEAMNLGVAPVLISDRYLLPPGPDWSSFLVRVPESDLAQLPNILDQILPSAAQRGALARQAYLNFFAANREFDHIIDLAARALRHGPPAERVFRTWQKVNIAKGRVARASRQLARSAILRTLRVFGLKNPYQMNR